MNNSNLVKQKAQALKQRLLILPVKVGDTAVLFSKQRFREQAWVDKVTTPWKARKPGANRNKGRALLVSTGRLRRSIRIIRTTSNTVTIGSNVPYAKAHNDGFKGTVTVNAFNRTKWKKVKVDTGNLTKTGKKSMKTITSANGEINVKVHTRRMNIPRRRFIGNSTVLDKQITRLIASQIMKTFKQ